MRNAWRLDALDKWRETVDRDLAGCRKDLDGMLNAEAVAEAVVNAVRADRRNLFSVPQKIVGGLLAVAVAIGAIVDVLRALGRA